MSSEVGDQHVVVFRTGRRPTARLLLACVMSGGLGVLVVVTASDTFGVVVGLFLLTLSVVYSSYLGWIALRRPPLVAVSTVGLTARPLPLGRVPEPVRWHMIESFEIVRWRQSRLMPAVRLLAVQLRNPDRPRWRTLSGRWNVKRHGTPFVIPEGFLDVRLEAVLDAARAFTDAPLTYEDDQARQPRERWRISGSG